MQVCAVRARQGTCSVSGQFTGGCDRNSGTGESVSLDMCTDHTNLLLEFRPKNNSTISSEISLFFLLANSGSELLQQKLASFRKDLFEAPQQKACRFLAGESQGLPGTHGPGQTGKRLHPASGTHTPGSEREQGRLRNLQSECLLLRRVHFRCVKAWTFTLAPACQHTGVNDLLQ